MDLILELIFWIIGAVFERQAPRKAEINKASHSKVSESEAKSVDVWETHRMRQAAIEAEYQAKAPKPSSLERQTSGRPESRGPVVNSIRFRIGTHNPEVSGSNPLPTTQTRLESMT